MLKQVTPLKIPVFVLHITKDEVAFDSVDAIVAHYRAAIERHPCARFIGIFDHYAHTCGLPDGEIADGILDAKNVVFCFGIAIPAPEALATRPRSIGITELVDRYVIAFLEAPMPLANSAMETWTMELLEPR